MKLTKDMLKPGLYNERGQLLVVSKDDIGQLEQSVRVLQDAGYKIPVWLEHVPKDDRLSYPIKASDSELLSQAEGDPWFGGWITGINRDSNDVLHPEIEVEDSLGKKLSNVGTYVSPQFGEWPEIKDRAPLSLLHLALTRNPVNRDQSKKFIPAGIDSSGISGQTSNNETQMSLTQAIQNGVRTFSFSLSDAVGQFPNSAGSQTPAVPGNQPPGAGTGQQVDPHADLKSKLQSALQALGITLEGNSKILQDVDGMSRVLSLIASLEAEATEKQTQPASGMSGSGDPYSDHSTVISMSQTSSTPATPVAPTAPVAPVAPVTPAAPASLESRVQEQSDRIHQLSQAVVTQQGINDNLLKLLSVERREKYNREIDQLFATGRCTKAASDELKSLANVYQFSLTSPESKSELDYKIAAFSSLPEGAAWTATERMHHENITTHQFSQQGLSVFSQGAEPTEERADEILKELNRYNNAFQQTGVAAR